MKPQRHLSLLLLLLASYFSVEAQERDTTSTQDSLVAARVVAYREKIKGSSGKCIDGIVKRKEF